MATPELNIADLFADQNCAFKKPVGVRLGFILLMISRFFVKDLERNIFHGKKHAII
jgi:hypothetical protein